MLPDCECKGRAFLHSLQEITEKKCEKNSFAPILLLHSIAKSVVKPVFSPLPHPIFFVPKSPFFPLFPVSNPISGDFSRDRPRFLPCEAHFFLVLPRFGSDFGRFFERSHPLSSPHFSFRTARILFRFGFPLLSHLPHLHFPLISFPPFIPPTLFAPSPNFLLIPPHFSISLPNKRTIVRTLAHYARTRTPAPTHTSGGFRLLPSPLHPPLVIRCTSTH